VNLRPLYRAGFGTVRVACGLAQQEAEMHLLMRHVIAIAGILMVPALPAPASAQTAGEGSGSEVVGSGAMTKNPEHAEKGGDKDRDPKRSDQPGKRSDADVSSGSISPSTAPQ
jgi:hypothetical protein